MFVVTVGQQCVALLQNAYACLLLRCCEQLAGNLRWRKILVVTAWLCFTRFTRPQVRLELQSCVSRQQEALRCREVCLLSQIELLEQVKTETLQQQLQQLHWVSLSNDRSAGGTATWATTHFCCCLCVSAPRTV